MTRRGYLAGLFTLAALAAPAAAQAHTTVTCEGVCPAVFQRWADSALVPTPSTTVSVRIGAGRARCGARHAEGCAEPRTTPPVIYLQFDATRATFFHELGHLTAYLYPRLASYLSERFAETYSMCARVPASEISFHHRYRLGAIREEGRAIRRECAVIRETVS